MTGRQSERFYHELRLVKFGGFAIESARHGFRAADAATQSP